MFGMKNEENSFTICTLVWRPVVTPKCVLWQIVKTQMQCHINIDNVTLHLGLNCLLTTKAIFREKNTIFFILNPLNLPKFIVLNQKEECVTEK